MSQPLPVFINKEDLRFDAVVIGPSGKGRSFITQRLADQEGVSYEEMERRFRPTEAQLKQREKEREQERQADESRLQAVRDAYWLASKESDFDPLHDVLVNVIDIEPTHDQVRLIFDLLPQIVISGVVAWGFSDTPVRDDVFTFVQNNESLVRSKLGL